MCTNDSNSGRGSKTSSPLCLPSNKRRRRDECALGTYQITTGELLIQHMQEASQGTSLASSPSLELVPRRPELATPSESPASQALVEPGTESDIPWSAMDAEAA